MAEPSVTAGSGHHQVQLAQIDEDVLKAANEKIEAHVREIKFKIHRFPASLRGFGRDMDYVVPRIVAIGPYYHRVPELQAMEEVKRLAAYYFFEGLAKTPELRGYYADEVYKKILSVARDVRGCYADADALEGITDDDFAAMMFFDGCFLVQCMDFVVSEGQSLLTSVIRSKGPRNIMRDMMLLENQIPWTVLHLLTALRPVPMEDFIAHLISCCDPSYRRLQPVIIDEYFEPPHLLGLIHFYQVRPSSVKKESRQCLECRNLFRILYKLNYEIFVKFFPSKRLLSSKKHKGVEEIAATTSAAELAEIGVKLTSSGTTQFSDMKVERGPLFATLSLASLVLGGRTACWLVNMVAFEQCTGTSWEANYPVNSYLSVMEQLMNRDDDVRELRGKRIVHSAFDDNQTLKFFKRMSPHLIADSSFLDILVGLEEYKHKRWVWIAIHKFLYNNAKTIATVLSIVGVLVPIFKTLISLKQNQS